MMLPSEIAYADSPSVTRRGRARKRCRRRLNGEGTICRRSDGRWVGALSSENGRRHFLYGGSADDVAKKLEAAKEAERRGLQPEDDRITVGTVLQRFLDERRSRTRPATMVDYENVVNKHLAPALGRIRLRKLSSANVQQFLDTKRAELSVTMVRHIRTILRMAVQLAVSWDLVSRNVVDFVRGPKADGKQISPLDVGETRKLLEAAQRHRLGPLWLLAATLGLRRGELLGLAWNAVDLDVGTVAVRAQLLRIKGKNEISLPKTANGRRLLRLPPGLVTVLREHRRRQSAERLDAGALWRDVNGLVFTQLDGSPISGPCISQAHRRLCATAGVRHVRLHDLRHGAATIMLAAGVDPRSMSETLGHSRVSFTLNCYAHTKRPQLDAAVDKVAAALLG